MSQRGEPNRFHAWLNTTWKRRAFFGALLTICFVLLEIAAVGVTAGFSYGSGRNLEQVEAQFLLARPFFDNPVTKLTKAEYVGYLPTPSAQRRWNVADPILGWRNGRNVGATNAHGYAEGVEWRTTNRQGFLSAGELDFDVALRKPPGVFRIFILGGSTVAGYGVETPFENLPAAFSAALRQRLSATPGFDNIQVVNAGVDGYSSFNDYLYFATELVHYDPDLVVFYGGWNDYLFWDADPVFAKRSSQHTKLQQRLNDSYTVFGAARLLAGSIAARGVDLSFQLASRWIPKRLIEKVFVDRSLTLGEGGAFDIDNNLVQTPRNQDAKASRQARVLYETNTRDEIALARDRRIKVAYFLQPLLGVGDKQPEGYEAEWLRVNTVDAGKRRELRGIQRDYDGSSDVCIEDLSLALDAEPSRVYSDSGHLNQKGNAIVAVSMVNALEACSMFEPSPDSP